MGEKRQIFFVFAATLLLGLGAVLLVAFFTTIRNPVQSLEDTGSLAGPGALLAGIGEILVLLIPFLFLALYFIFGREKIFVVVPEYLSTIPDKSLSPLQVNLLFKGSPFSLDEDGFYATLLDLHRKKKIEIRNRPDKRGVLIRVLDYEGTDDYEHQVLDFLSAHQSRGVFDSGFLAKIVSETPSGWDLITKDSNEVIEVDRAKKYNRAKMIQRQLNSLIFRTDDALMERYVSNGTRLTLPFIITGVFFFCAAYWILDSVQAVKINALLPTMILLSGLCIVSCVLVFYSSLGKYGDCRKKVEMGDFPVNPYRDAWDAIPAPETVIRTLRVDRPVPVIAIIATEFLVTLMVALCMFFDPHTPQFVSAGALLFGLVIIVQSSIAYYYALIVFSRWRDDRLREKMQWDAFSRFLSGFTGMEGNHPEDMEQWGEWLVYGTALGVGTKIGIVAELAGLDRYYPYMDNPDFPWFGDFHTLSSFTIEKM